LNQNTDSLDPSPRELILLHGGAGALNRKWPASNWQELRRLIEQDKSLTVETLQCILTKESLLSSFAFKSKKTCENTTSVQQLSEKIQKSHLVICNDSLVAHIASWYDIPVIVISPHSIKGDPMHMNSPERFGPWSSHSVVIRPTKGLDNCVSHCKVRKSHCIATITPKDVYMQTLLLMQQIMDYKG
jgi:ADP-heptose:LPS heptosyltransferase